MSFVNNLGNARQSAFGQAQPAIGGAFGAAPVQQQQSVGFGVPAQPQGFGVGAQPVSQFGGVQAQPMGVAQNYGRVSFGAPNAIVSGLDGRTNLQAPVIFGSMRTIESTKQYASVRKVMKELFTAILCAEPILRTVAQERSGQIVTNLIENVIKIVARNPSIVGENGGITIEDATSVVAGVWDRITKVQTNAAVLGAESGPRFYIVSAVAARWANNVMLTDEAAISSTMTQLNQKLLTMQTICIAVGMRPQFYNAKMLNLMMRIQTDYNATTRVQGVANILNDPEGINQLCGMDQRITQINSISGRWHGLVELATRCTYAVQDQRDYRLEQATSPAAPSSIFVMSPHAVRVLITSCLEMSELMGHATKTIATKPATGQSTGIGIGRVVNWSIKKDSPIYQLIVHAVETKTVFNASGEKDAEKHLKQPAAGDMGNGWGIFADAAGNLTFESSNLVTEIETRCRIDSHNTTPYRMQVPANQQVPKRSPDLVYFAHSPKELRFAIEVMNTARDMQTLESSLNQLVRADTRRRVLECVRANYSAQGDMAAAIRHFEAMEEVIVDAVISSNIIRICNVARVAMGASSPTKLNFPAFRK